MIIEQLDQARREEFLNFCRKHRNVLDDSFLYDEDLAEYEPDAENPTYITLNPQGEIAGAASLILDEYSRRGRKARFRILHAESGDAALYRELLQAVIQHTAGLDKLNIFVPTVNTGEMGKLAAAGFTVERYSFLLVRDQNVLPEIGVPAGYELKPFQAGADEAVWCGVRNAGFAKLQGSETTATPDMVSAMIAGGDYIEGGMLLLYHDGRAVGIVRGSDDEYNDVPIRNIGPLALLPEYQGIGLGRVLLRAAVHVASAHGYSRSILCVNAENERAKALYIGEGFSQVEAAACCRYDLT